MGLRIVLSSYYIFGVRRTIKKIYRVKNEFDIVISIAKFARLELRKAQFLINSIVFTCFLLWHTG